MSKTHRLFDSLNEQIKFLRKTQPIIQCPICEGFMCNCFNIEDSCPEVCEKLQAQMGVDYCRNGKTREPTSRCTCVDVPLSKNMMVLTLIASLGYIEELEYQVASLQKQCEPRYKLHAKLNERCQI